MAKTYCCVAVLLMLVLLFAVTGFAQVRAPANARYEYLEFGRLLGDDAVYWQVSSEQGEIIDTPEKVMKKLGVKSNQKIDGIQIDVVNGVKLDKETGCIPREVDVLNKLAIDGWELVSTYSEVTYVLRRSR